MKKTVFIFSLFTLIFWAAVSSASTTVDLLNLFDTNSDGRAQFGDGFYSNKDGLDYDEQEAVTELFNLMFTPASTGSFSLTLTYDNVQTAAYFNLNGTDYAPLGSGAGTRTYTGSVSELLGIGNSLTFYVFPISIGSTNLDDYSLSQLMLVYDEAAAVPVPGSLSLFGFGLIGLAGLGRKYQKRE